MGLHELELYWFECLILAVWSSTTYLVSLNLSFFIGKTEVVGLASEGCVTDKILGIWACAIQEVLSQLSRVLLTVLPRLWLQDEGTDNIQGVTLLTSIPGEQVGACRVLPRFWEQWCETDSEAAPLPLKAQGSLKITFKPNTCLLHPTTKSKQDTGYRFLSKLEELQTPQNIFNYWLFLNPNVNSSAFR